MSVRPEPVEGRAARRPGFDRLSPNGIVILFILFAALVLGLGIDAATGLTGKDEYLLGLRIPLEMMQGDHWWVPFIDGAPRLKKPPLLYWLGRASFETFGPSLLAARGITVAFALLLLGCTAWLGKRFGANWQSGLLAAGVLLGISGLASESRRLMLDVPVAALSVAAFCCYLRWLDSVRTEPVEARPLLRRTALAPSPFDRLRANGFLALTAVCLSAALLTKGPIALVACGGGLLALWIVEQDSRRIPFRHWLAHLTTLILALALPAIWFLYVRRHYGAELAAATADEFEARQLSHLSIDPAIGILTLALPWSFVALHALWTQRRQPAVRFLGLWLALTLLPFFFIRSFERYLIGSLPAIALLASIGLQHSVPAWTRRTGSLLPALLAAALAALLWRWQLPGWPWLLVTLCAFVFIWWRATASAPALIVSAAALWAAGWGLAFPGLGVNALPASLVDLARNRPVILFAGPQPALLPMRAGRPLRQTSRLDSLDPTQLAAGTAITLRAEDQPLLDAQLAALGRNSRLLSEYSALTSSGSGIRFARAGATRADWEASWRERSPQPLMSHVRVLELLP
ncbi:MAG: phospholipid carrier-dependent glycosyltransferase [Rhodocyclaceae bacterium]|nr:phospholipid carrier-dependent glycosyltransferase [Rhodocyclaceae bacterium]